MDPLGSQDICKAIQGAGFAAVQNRMSPKIQHALYAAGSKCFEMAQRNDQPAGLIELAKQTVAEVIARENILMADLSHMNAVNDEALIRSLQCALEAIAKAGAEEQISQTQFNNITCIRIADEDRIGDIWDRALYYLKMTWLRHLPLQWLWQRKMLSDRDVFLMHKTAGNNAYRNFLITGRRDHREEYFSKEIIGNYEKALERGQGASRIPVYFKEAQAYLLRHKSEEELGNLIKCKDILFLEEQSIKNLYDDLSKDLRHMADAAKSATDVIHAVLEVLINYHSEIADVAASLREELNVYEKSFPDLKSVKEALRELPEVQKTPALLVEVGRLPSDIKDPEALAKALQAYGDVIESIEKVGQPWETTLLISQQLKTLDTLNLYLVEYQQLHQEVAVYEALEKLLRDIGSFKMDFDDSGDDILSFAEEHPKVLVSIADQLDQLARFKDLPEELQKFAEDLNVFRDAFEIRATANERIGFCLLKFFEEIPAQHKEIAQKYLENLRLPHSKGENYFLMAYKDYMFASRLFDVAIAQVKEKIEQFKKEFFEELGDERFLVEDALLTMEERQEKEKMEADFAKNPWVVGAEAKVRAWQEEDERCEKGQQRVFDAIKNNKNITERGTYFLARYGVGADSFEVYYALGNRYYYGANIGSPEERYAKAVGAYQKSLEEFLKFELEEGKTLTVPEQSKRNRAFKQLQNGVEKASRMRKSAEYMAAARACIAACLSEGNSEDSKRLDLHEKIIAFVMSAIESEEQALLVGCDCESIRSGTNEEKRAKKQMEVIDRREVAKVEASNLSELYRMLAKLCNERALHHRSVDGTKKAREYNYLAQQRKDEGFRFKGDYTGEYALNLDGFLEGVQGSRVAKICPNGVVVDRDIFAGSEKGNAEKVRKQLLEEVRKGRRIGASKDAPF